MTIPFNAKSEILSAIAKTDDPAMKTVLLLLLGVFEEIGSKIDSVLKNERALRETVLNGHTDAHHSHHEWLERRINRDHEMDLLLQWVVQARDREIDAASSKRKIRDGLIENVLWAALIALFGFYVGKI